MTTATVNIDSLDKIQAFVKIINNYNGRFDLVSGCSRVNAKSIMGIFSLDISRPLYLNIYNDENAHYVTDAISAFII
ncbi:MAG TPA: HPr family phosphocarrier protein [Candidatus Anaerobutyricum avicola]|nr:HPr family phosphocarrier protein [Candidatus Anaerobutyricum avicola]